MSIDSPTNSNDFILSNNDNQIKINPMKVSSNSFGDLANPKKINNLNTTMSPLSNTSQNMNNDTIQLSDSNNEDSDDDDDILLNDNNSFKNTQFNNNSFNNSNQYQDEEVSSDDEFQIIKKF